MEGVMNLVERVKNIILQPKSEWLTIGRESGDAGYLFPNYVCILAAIPVVCSFIGTSIIGFGSFRIGIVSGLIHAIVVYLLTLVGVFVVAYLIDALAPTFGGRKDLGQAMKVSAYAPTAAWLAGVFNIIPLLSFLGLLGLYSLYLLHTGLAALMKPAGGKEIIYTLAVVICVIVIQLIIFFVIVKAIFGVGM